MNRIVGDNTINHYLDQICAHIKARDIHANIKQELLIHLQEKVEMYMEDGLSKEDAVNRAIEEFGDPAQIGRNLHRLYRPVFDWGLFGLLAMIVSIGLFAMFAVDAYYLKAPIKMFNGSLLNRQLIMACLGMFLAIPLWFVNYQKLKRLSPYLFVSILILMVFTMLFGMESNGSRLYWVIGTFGLNVQTIAIYGLLIACAGMKPASKWNGRDTTFHLLIRLFIPLLLFIEMNTRIGAVIYLIGFTVLLLVSRIKVQYLLSYIPLGVIGGFYTLNQPYIRSRLRAFLNFRSDPLGDGYIPTVIHETIKEAGWFGQGLGAVNNKLPYVFSDGLFPYLIYCFGWITGIGIASVILFFLIRMISLIIHLHDDYGKRLISVIVAVLSINYLWTLLSSIGLVPQSSSTTLPFLTYGGYDLVIHFTLIGLIFTVHKQRNLMSSAKHNSN